MQANINHPSCSDFNESYVDTPLALDSLPTIIAIHISLDLRMAIARRNINDPGPGSGQIQSPLIGNLYLDITNELAAERNAAARQAKLDQQKRDRERQEEERNRREWEERELQASRITFQPITLEDLESATEQVNNS